MQFVTNYQQKEKSGTSFHPRHQDTTCTRSKLSVVLRDYKMQ